jgi:hypothetical protein
MDIQAQERVAQVGFQLVPIELPVSLREKVEGRDWAAVDRIIALEVAADGAIFAALQKFAKFTQIEFIISIRSSLEVPDEDGIWHDDGSRVLAFSLSLTLNSSKVEGGRLEIRKRGPQGNLESQETQVIPTPPFGTMIVFATGWQGYEHKINRVSGGERIIIAGWCT